MGIFNVQYGVIPAGGVQTVSVGGRPPPFTATLTSTASNRAINLSTNHLATPAFSWPNDAISTGMINTVITGPVTDIQFVGNPGDAWEV